MPWKVCKPMDERLKFIARLLDGQMAGLCREFGISRKTVNRRARPATRFSHAITRQAWKGSPTARAALIAMPISSRSRSRR